MSLPSLRVACVASLLAACLLTPAAASSLRAPPLAARRLRGGFDALDDDDDEPAVGLPLNDDADLDGASSDGPEVEEPITDREPPERPPNKALTKPQILEKLNAIPVFCLLTKDDGIVGMKGEGDDETSCCWFTDPLEARALLKHMSDNNPETELHMGCHSLGAVFSRCGGWPKGEEPEGFELPAEEPTSAGGTPVALKLKGSHGVTKEVQPQLIELMKKAGIDPGSWQLPVFFCDELQVRKSAQFSAQFCAILLTHHLPPLAEPLDRPDLPQPDRPRDDVGEGGALEGVGAREALADGHPDARPADAD